MRIPKKSAFAAAITCLLCAGLLNNSSRSSAQEGQKLPKAIFIQAQAMGESTQMGRTFSLNVIIEEFSSPEDQKVLVDVFNQKQNEGLVNALHKMKSKGRISITGTLGYDLAYVRKFDLPDGSTKIRLVTDRPISFGEAWTDNRSMEYSLSAAEIILSKDGKKNSGILLPACKFKINKENHLELELLRNEWKLVDVRER